MSAPEAGAWATEIANRVAAFVSLAKGIGVTPVLMELNQLGPEGQVRRGITNRSVELTVDRPTQLDLANPSVDDAIRGNDLTALLGHYALGLNATEVTTQVVEFYQLIEALGDRAPKEQYAYVRHFVAHARICKPTIEQKVRHRFGTNRFDPNSPQHLAEITKDVRALRREARKLLVDKLGVSI